MPEPAISIDGLGKRYQIGAQRSAGRMGELLSDVIRAPLNRLRNPASKATWIWALRNLRLDIQQGDVVGIVGRNGAGKSTLLKILSRVTEPTEGSAILRGRVGTLLEVGTGFHAELSGRENVYLSGAVLGMRRAEIDRKFDDIVEFSGVGQFLDTPVKRYSSGMQVRLGFAVAAHLEPEILVVDEVLAVGDAAFQKKCLGKMGEVATQGRTVLFVSHNMRAISSLCSRAILLENGEMVLDGTPSEAIAAYDRLWSDEADVGDGTVAFGDDGSSDAQITSVQLSDANGVASLRHDVLQPIDVAFDFILRADYPTLLACCEVRAGDGTLVYQTMQSDWQNFAGPAKADQFPMPRGGYRATIHMPAPLLSPGRYELELYLTTGPFRQNTRKGIPLEIVDRESFVSYVTRTPRGGVVTVPVRWDLEPAPTNAESSTSR